MLHVTGQARASIIFSNSSLVVVSPNFLSINVFMDRALYNGAQEG